MDPFKEYFPALERENLKKKIKVSRALGFATKIKHNVRNVYKLLLHFSRINSAQ